MAKTAYQCERCNAIYDYREQAEQCETDHSTRESGATIRHFIWKHDPQQPGEFPVRVVVLFKDDKTTPHGNMATYKLERIGFNRKL